MNPSIVPFVVSVVSLLAVFFPHSAKIVLLSQHPDEVMKIAGFVGGIISSVWLWISHPPAALRGPWDGLKLWLAGSFRRNSKS